jgi:leucyl aminopeptidase (aminopeptidase T)
MTALDDHIRRAARRIVAECANIRAGEHVYIEGRLDSTDYLELLAFECERLGATAFVAPRSDALAHRRLLDLPREQLKRTSRVQLEAVHSRPRDADRRGP